MNAIDPTCDCACDDGGLIPCLNRPADGDTRCEHCIVWHQPDDDKARAVAHYTRLAREAAEAAS